MELPRVDEIENKKSNIYMKKCQCPIHLLCYRLTSSRQQQQKHCYSQTRFDFGKNCFSRFRRPKRCQASDFYAREKKILDSNPHSISTCTAFCPLIYFVNILHSAKRINHIRLCFFFFLSSSVSCICSPF